MTMPQAALKARIQAQFPEGLTGVFAPGGTRTTYILEKNRQQDDPGKIEDIDDYMAYGLQKTTDFCRMYYDLGGSHLIVGISSFWRFEERSSEYIASAVKNFELLISDRLQAFYRENLVAPFFAGLDTLLMQDENTAMYQIAQQLQDFQEQWHDEDADRKLIWEMVPIPLYSIWQKCWGMSAPAHNKLAAAISDQKSNLVQVYLILYQEFVQSLYNTDLPIPHFCLAQNRNGDMKIRAHAPFALDMGGNTRMYYTQYPSLMMTREGLATILEDLLNDKRFRSLDTDYRGKMTPELAQKLYHHFQQLASDPTSTIGLSQNVLDVIASDDIESA